MRVRSVLLAWCGLTAAAPDTSVIQVRVTAQDGGTPHAGQPIRVTVIARDTATGYPLTGMTPALWLVPDDGDRSTGRCERLINRIAASAVPTDGTADANGFDLVQATDDGKLALVDPLLNLATANIKAMTDLGRPPLGWAIDPAGTVMLAAVPGEPSIAQIDMAQFHTVRRIPISAAATSLVSAGGRFYAGLEDGSAISLAPSRLATPVVTAVGHGAVHVVAAEDGIVALAASGEGAFIGDGRPPRTFAIGRTSGALAYSAPADAAFALTGPGDGLAIVRQDDPAAVVHIPLDRRAVQLTMSPDGRWLALVAADGAAVTIVETARAQPRWTVGASDPVIAAAFSDNFLYLMHRRQGGATRVVFDPSGGPPSTVTIAAGSNRETDQAVAALPMMARIPQAGMLIASTRDRSAYMINDDNSQAAMSSLPLRAGNPVGILLRNRGLVRARDRGTYTTDLVLPHGGAYLAVVRTEQPAIAHCARVSITAAPGEARRIAAVERPRTPRRLDIAPVLNPGAQTLRFTISGFPVALSGAMLMGDGWQMIPTDVRSTAHGFAMPVDLPPGRAITLFVRYGEATGEEILSAPVRISR